MHESLHDAPPPARPPEDRLDSWKEIAAYLNRDVTTVQRWEKREGMPVHRHLHDRVGSVYAFRTDLDEWARTRNSRAAHDDGNNGVAPDSSQPIAEEQVARPPVSSNRNGSRLALGSSLP